MDVVHENVPKKTACRCEFVFLDHCFLRPCFLNRLKIKCNVHIKLEIPIHLLCICLVKNNKNEEKKQLFNRLHFQ